MKQEALLWSWRSPRSLVVGSSLPCLPSAASLLRCQLRSAADSGVPGALPWFFHCSALEWAQRCWARIVKSANSFDANSQFPYSTIGDALIVSCYALLFSGLFLYLITYVRTLAGVLATSALGVVCLIAPILLLDENLLSRFFDLIYPVFDIAFLGLAILGFAVLKAGKLARAWQIIIAAIVIEVVAALVMDYQVSNGGYSLGNFVYMMYFAGYWLLVFGLSYPHEGLELSRILLRGSGKK